MGQDQSTKVKLKRAISVSEIYNAQFETLDLPDEWKKSLGEVSNSFSMIVWGGSGKGKNRYVLALCKVLAVHAQILFDCLEEGLSLTMQRAFKATNMMEVAGKILLVDREKYQTLVYRLSKRKSPKIVVINSIQHMRMTYEQWTELRAKFRKKIFILISHADGKEPAGSAAKEIRYDVDIKVNVDHYVAYPDSRYGGNTPFIIWPERALIRPDWKRHFQATPSQGGQLSLITENNTTNA